MTGLSKPLLFACLHSFVAFLHSGSLVWMSHPSPLPRSAARGSNNEQRKTRSGSEDISASDLDWPHAIKSTQNVPRSEDKVIKARYDDAAAMDDAHKETTFSAHSNLQSI